MGITTQMAAVTVVSLRSIPQRLGNSLVIVVGITGVVAALLCVLAMSMSFRETIRGDGRADRAIVLSRSAITEYESSLSREDVAIISAAPGIKHDANNKPLVSAEVVLVAPVARKRDNSDVNATLRGVGEQYFAMRPELKLIAGRMFRAGTQELVVGESARGQFAGLEIGNQIRLQGGDWTIVGTFAGGSGSRGSEVIADAKTAMSAYKLESVNTMTVMLDSARSLTMLKDALSAEPTLAVDVRSEPEYLATAASSVNRVLRWTAYAIGSIMALGALFGTLNSMHFAVAARTVEIATLRAIGFSSIAVAGAVLIESLVLALIGATIGVAIAYAAFNGTVISTLGGALFDSQLVYALILTPKLIATSILIVCAVALLGGIVPAFRAANSNVVEALREA